MNCIIIDDEQLAIDALTWQLTEFCEGIQIQETFTNPKDAINYLVGHKVDLCFLDIDMPEMTGFEFLKEWKDKPPFEVIFTTAYSEYAIQAFRVSALDYLLKPIDEEELIETIKKFKILNAHSDLSNQLQLLMTQLHVGKKFSSQIAIPTIEGIHIIDVSKISRLEADNNYTTIYYEETSILVSKTLKELELMLDPNTFFRIHQSHIINLKCIKLYQRGRGGNVTLLDGAILPVSKTKKEKFLSILGI